MKIVRIVVKKYDDKFFKWCKSCQMIDLKENWTNYTSENDEIDDLILLKMITLQYIQQYGRGNPLYYENIHKRSQVNKKVNLKVYIIHVKLPMNF